MIAGVSGFDNRRRAMKLLRSLIQMIALVLVLVAIGCSSGEPDDPTPNIDATVEATATAKELVAGQATATPVVIVKEVIHTDISLPTNTSVPTHTPFTSKSPNVEGEDPTNRRMGNKVGDISPDFRIRLTTGEPLYSSTIRSNRMPVFLFFFSPL